MRDRLIELMQEWGTANTDSFPFESVADYLLANGVIVPPCKVGDTFYGLNESEYDDYEVLGFKWGKRRGDDEYVLLVLTVYDMEFEWGEEAFLTKEEAEQALKGGAE